MGLCFEAGLGLLGVVVVIVGEGCWEDSLTGLEEVLSGACLSALVDLIIASSFFFFTKAMMLICLMAEAEADEDEGEEGEIDDEGVVADATVVDDLEDSFVFLLLLLLLLLCCSQDSLALGVDSVAAFLLLGARCFGAWLLVVWGSSLGGGSGGGGGLKLAIGHLHRRPNLVP